MPLRIHEDIMVFYNKQPTYNPQKTIGNKNHSVGNKSKPITSVDSVKRLTTEERNIYLQALQAKTNEWKTKLEGLLNKDKEQ